MIFYSLKLKMSREKTLIQLSLSTLEQNNVDFVIKTKN